LSIDSDRSHRDIIAEANKSKSTKKGDRSHGEVAKINQQATVLIFL
jgi:hypothetical protein